MRIAPITPPPASNSDWYSSSCADAESSPEAREPPDSAENGSCASPRIGWPDAASRSLYARAAARDSSAYGYGHPATRSAAADVVCAKRTSDWYCSTIGYPMTHNANTSSSADRRRKPHIDRRSLRCRFTRSDMSIASGNGVGTNSPDADVPAALSPSIPPYLGNVTAIMRRAPPDVGVPPVM